MARRTEQTLKPGGRGTSYDVARRAGVSQSAVSRCFRPGASVAPETRRRILQAAEELGYRPNAIAKGLITRQSNLIAVIISNLTNLYYPEVLAELTMRLSAAGRRVLLFTLRSESEIDEVLDQVWSFRADGAIVAARLTPAQLQQFERYGVPLVLYNREAEDHSVAAVLCESGNGERMLIDGLLAAGCRSFGIIAGPPDSTVGIARVNGALARLAAEGITGVPIVEGDYSYDSGHAGALELLADGPIDAIVAANDVMALGAMDAARIDLGHDVPGQVSVVGFDGVAPARWRSYQLSTVRQPVRRMTDAAVTMLLERIDDPDLGPERRLFSGDLVAGTSARLK